ncbi:hypothetical protein J2X59_001378 [Flavobacterium sp. 260]|nr:hypothetical protein [Curtobacterium sp. 260]
MTLVSWSHDLPLSPGRGGESCDQIDRTWQVARP